MKTADYLFCEAFDRPRDPRSDAYKGGVVQGLKVVFGEECGSLPFEMGTVEADAWIAGVDEGRRRGKNYLCGGS